MLKQLTIGSLVLQHNVVLAPLAGITNHAFRRLCRIQGAACAFTEMVSVNGLVREGTKTLALLNSSANDRPLGIQLFGDRPADLAEAARMVEPYGDLIDINMGCPVRKVVSTGAGSALLRDTLQIAAIIREVRRATRLPLTIKFRSGWNAGDDVFVEVAKIAEQEGCDAVTLHPRSRSQMFSGLADWDQIRCLKQEVSIPVIGSGDLFRATDCLTMLEQTGCDGVMVARGALGNPWIFRQVRILAECGYVPPVTNRERSEMIRLHLELFRSDSGDLIAVREMKKHIAWYARGFSGAAEIRRSAQDARTVADINTIMERIADIPDERTSDSASV